MNHTESHLRIVPDEAHMPATSGPRRARSHLRIVPEEAQMPATSRRRPARSRNRWAYRLVTVPDLLRLTMSGSAAFLVVFIYIGVPIALLAGDRLDSLLHAVLLAAAAVVLGASIVLCVLHSTNLDVEKENDMTESVVGVAERQRLVSAAPKIPGPARPIDHRPRRAM
jgi:hypothetical protein